MQFLKSLTKKQTISLIIFLVLIVSVPVTVYLAKQIQVFKPKAQETTRASPSAATSVLNKKVLAIIFDPVLQNGNRLTQEMRWQNSYSLFRQVIDSFRRTSNGRVNFNIVQTIAVNGWPRLRDGFTYDERSYLSVVRTNNPPHTPDNVDIQAILDQYDVCGKLNRGEIDELWVMGGPWFGFYESQVAGPNAFWSSAPPLRGTSCNRTLYIMGFSYERELAEMLEDFAHRTEGIMTILYRSWSNGYGSTYGSEQTNWDKFTLLDLQRPGRGGCGNAHGAVNALPSSEDDFWLYDRTNSRVVQSFCDDFLNYPNLRTITTNISCQAWGCTAAGYLEWWFRHIPHFQGFGTDGISNDWWTYIIDTDNIGPQTVYTPLTPSPTPSDSTSTPRTLELSISGNTDNNQVFGSGEQVNLAARLFHNSLIANNGCVPTDNYIVFEIDRRVVGRKISCQALSVTMPANPGDHILSAEFPGEESLGATRAELRFRISPQPATLELSINGNTESNQVFDSGEQVNLAARLFHNSLNPNTGCVPTDNQIIFRVDGQEVGRKLACQALKYTMPGLTGRHILTAAFPVEGVLGGATELLEFEVAPVLPSTPSISGCVQPSPSGCPIQVNSPRRAVLGSPSDVHVWTVSTSASGVFSVILSKLSVDYDIAVYEARNSNLVGSSNNEGTEDEIIVLPVGSNDYKVVVGTQRGQVSPNSYQIEVRITPGTVSPTPSIQPSSAPTKTIFSISTNYTGEINYLYLNNQFNPDQNIPLQSLSLTLPGIKDQAELFAVPIIVTYSDGTSRLLPFIFNYKNAPIPPINEVIPQPSNLPSPKASSGSFATPTPAPLNPQTPTGCVSTRGTFCSGDQINKIGTSLCCSTDTQGNPLQCSSYYSGGHCKVAGSPELPVNGICTRDTDCAGSATYCRKPNAQAIQGTCQFR